ncbi:MAG: hypothetical protein ACE5GK_11675 [Nitrospiria bacterium]
MKTIQKMRNYLVQKETRRTVLALLFVLLFSTAAMAIVAPVAGSFAYDAYDIGVNKILKGPIGFILGVLAIGFGAWAAIRTEIIMAISAVLGGAILIKADTVVASLGMLI